MVFGFLKNSPTFSAPIPMVKKGMILPLVIIVSLLLLTASGIWYRKALVQSFLSERVVTQRMIYKECNSLIPILLKKLDQTPAEELETPDSEFMTVAVKGKTKWIVERSKFAQKRVVFVFKSSAESIEPIRMTVGYSIK